jgi:invasion protein IalB
MSLMQVFQLPIAALAAVATSIVPAAAQRPAAQAQTAQAPAAVQPPAAQAPAQNTPMASDGGTGWRVECANDGKALDCQTVNKVSQRESGQVVTAVAIRIPPDTKKPVLMVQLPLGIQVNQQVSVQVDEGKAERYPIQTCAQNGCFVAVPVADQVIGALRGGKTLKVAFQSVTSQTITVTMPLGGFALAYDKIK